MRPFAPGAVARFVLPARRLPRRTRAGHALALALVAALAVALAPAALRVGAAAQPPTFVATGTGTLHDASASECAVEVALAIAFDAQGAAVATLALADSADVACELAWAIRTAAASPPTFVGTGSPASGFRGSNGLGLLDVDAWAGAGRDVAFRGCLACAVLGPGFEGTVRSA